MVCEAWTWTFILSYHKVTDFFYSKMYSDSILVQTGVAAIMSKYPNIHPDAAIMASLRLYKMAKEAEERTIKEFQSQHDKYSHNRFVYRIFVFQAYWLRFNIITVFLFPKVAHSAEPANQRFVQSHNANWLSDSREKLPDIQYRNQWRTTVNNQFRLRHTFEHKLIDISLFFVVLKFAAISHAN